MFAYNFGFFHMPVTFGGYPVKRLSERGSAMKRLIALLSALAILTCLSVLALADDVIVVEDDDPPAATVSAAEEPAEDTAAAADSAVDYRSQIEALEEKYDQLEEQQKAAQAEINKVQGEKNKQIAQKQQIDNQISGTRQQISVLSDKISLLEGNIAEQQTALEEKQAEIDENYTMLKKRLRSMYASGNATVLGLVLGAEDFPDFLSRTQVASRIARHDRDLLNMLHDDLEEIQEIKTGIEENKSEVEYAKTQQANKQAVLTTQLAETNDMIQDLDQLEAEYKANKAAIDAAMKQAQAEIDEIYRMMQPSTEAYEGGIMFWPVTGYSTLTSYYGYRFNGSDFHTGIDISGKNSAGVGIYGQPIRAAASGTVTFTRSWYINGYAGGYGIYCMLDHGTDDSGNSISTLYGHMSRLAVSTGDVVQRGQVIGYVGSTGWSTGPHLHFEVRINGVHTNPLPYLT